jgi:two-component system, OmpR family, aerobic respiration control sensor histidine kinase ArcB
MYVLPFLHYTAFIVDLGVIGLLLYRNSKAALNLTCSLFFATFAVWSLGFCFLDLSHTLQEALFWMKFASVGWCIFPAATFYFALALTQQPALMRKKFLLIIVVAVTVFFLYLVFNGYLIVNLENHSYWWYGIWGKSIFPYLFFLYYLAMSVICIYFLYQYGRKARNTRQKMQAKIPLVTAVFSLGSASLVNVILPVMGIIALPQVADLCVMVWAVGVIFSVIRYGMMSVTPAAASDQILSTMTDSLILLDTQGNIKLANRATGELLGINEKELVGKDFESLVLEKASGLLLLTNTLSNGSSINRELTYLSSDNRAIQVHVSASSVLDQLKTNLGFVVVARDISERKKIEDKTRELYEQEKLQREELEEEAKIRMKFIDMLAHEMRGPLTPIMASAGMFLDLDDSNLNDIQRKLIGNINAGTQTLVKRLDDLLDMARNARGNFTLNLQQTNIPHFIEDVVSRFKPTLDQRNQQLILELQKDLPSVDVDASRLEQVMVNLLSNACKYSPDYSPITLRVSNGDGHILIEVEDHGFGISSEDQAKLFQPYYRFGRAQHHIKGLGLGLTVVKQIVEAHGGKIWVNSQPEKGSTFSFIIPVKTAAGK